MYMHNIAGEGETEGVVHREAKLLQSKNSEMLRAISLEASVFQGVVTLYENSVRDVEELHEKNVDKLGVEPRTARRQITK